MKKALLALILLQTLAILFARAQEDSADSARSRRWYVPHYIPLQFAGNIGFLSTGFGYTSNHDNYHLNILYGYVPASLAGTPVHTITAKNIFPLTRYPLNNNRTLIPYLGIGLTVEVGGIVFFKMPSHYPESYYDFPKNVHVIAYGGARLQHLFQDNVPIIRGFEFYVETGTVDVYLWYKSISDQIRFKQIFSVALGVNLLLDD